MPPINLYRCNKCGFSFPLGWGGHMYVEDENKNRIICPHPLEWETVAKILGKKASRKIIINRVGFNSYCVCLDCLYQFEADLRDEKANPYRKYYENRIFCYSRSFIDKFIFWRKQEGLAKYKDPRECPKCRSTNVKTVFELIGEVCPRCKEGIIEEIVTGIIS